MIQVRKRYLQYSALAGLLLALLASVETAMAAFSASVDRTVMAMHDTFELTLRSDSKTTAAPAMSVLENDFAILGTRQSQQVRIINGRNESWRDWVITLSPKRVGTLTIPAIQLGTATSAPITVTVRATHQPGGAVDNVSPVFIKATLDNEQVYTQQEIVMALKIFHRVSLYDESRLTPLTVDHALVQQLGETQKYETVIDGTRYGVFALRFALYPQKAGTLTIPALTFTGTVADRRSSFASFFATAGKSITARSPVMTVTVQAPPASDHRTAWLPARNLTISEAWSQPVETIQVGDAVTRTITLQADGLTAAQLPPVATVPIEGMNTYTDQTATEDTPTDQGMRGTRTAAIAMVPTQAGTVVLPAIRYAWFDTHEQVMKTADLPSKTLTILPAASGQPAAQQPLDRALASPSDPPVSTANNAVTVSALLPVTTSPGWLWWLVALLTLLWLGTSGLLWRLWQQGQRAAKTPGAGASSENDSDADESTAFNALVTACCDEQPSVIRAAFKTWCRVFLAKPQLTTVPQYLACLDSPELSALYAKLDAGLYSDSGHAEATTGKALLALCRHIRKTYKQSKAAASTAKQLPALYPV